MHHCQTKTEKKILGRGHTPPRPRPLRGSSAPQFSRFGVPVPFHLRLEHCPRPYGHVLSPATLVAKVEKSAGVSVCLSVCLSAYSVADF